jgi:hypothetical protein
VKVIEGSFGKGKAPASEIFTKLSEMALEAEKDGATLELAAVIFIEEQMMQIVSNTQHPDGTYLLLQMASSSIMQDILTGG